MLIKFSTKLIIFLLHFFLISSNTNAQEFNFEGDWQIRITQETGGKRNQDGFLKIQNENGTYIAYIQGGPIKIKINNDSIEMAADDWTGGSMPFERYYRGRMIKGEMSGVFGPENDITEEQKLLCQKIPLGCPFPEGSWTAKRLEKESVTAKPSNQKINFTGKWGIVERGMRRWTMDLTDKAKKWNEEFNVELDLPRQRCVSSGFVNGFGSAPEIFQDKNKITIITSSEVRRIYLDDRVPPKYSDWYPLGFSSGTWENETLVVRTKNLMPSVRGFMGNPISSNSEIVERFEMDEDGILNVHMTLYDPENYKTPPVSTVKWKRVKDESVVFPLLCDPDSFYRQIYEEGDFDEYIKRGHRRY